MEGGATLKTAFVALGDAGVESLSAAEMIQDRGSLHPLIRKSVTAFISANHNRTKTTFHSLFLTLVWIHGRHIALLNWN